MKLNTKSLKFKCGLANEGGGGAGWSTHARYGYPHLVLYKMNLRNTKNDNETTNNFKRLCNTVDVL